MPRRPLIVWLIGGLMVLAGLVQMTWGLVFLAEREDVEVLRETGATTSQLAVLAIAMLALGALSVILAFALLSGSSIARLLVAVLEVLHVANGVYAAVAFAGARRVAGSASVAVGLLVLYLLFGTARAKAFFGDAAVEVPDGAPEGAPSV